MERAPRRAPDPGSYAARTGRFLHGRRAKARTGRFLHGRRAKARTAARRPERARVRLRRTTLD
jgi:hypothetical protein